MILSNNINLETLNDILNFKNQLKFPFKFKTLKMLQNSKPSNLIL